MPAACPNGGFSYGWDGATCAHCHDPVAPQIDRDELLEKRFVFKAQKHGLPSKRTWLFRDLPFEMQRVIFDIVNDRLTGKPVLAFIDSPSRWTLLSTRQILSWYDGRLHHASIDGLITIRDAFRHPRGATEEEIDLYKSTLEYLRLVDSDGEIIV